ncbi:MAG: T9SS type A sorting domain-containing protein [Candidatus Neomarinimicrobiota bacterium]
MIQDLLADLPSVGNDDADGSGLPNIASEILLYDAYPNPFNGTTAIGYTLPRRTKVSIDVLNLAGKRVRTIADEEEMAAGYHKVEWNAVSEPSGIYIIRLRSRGLIRTRKVVLVK